MKKRYLSIVLTITFILAAYTFSAAQTKVVSGKVTILNDLRVANVMVIAKNSGNKVLTDSSGCYNVICADKDVITFKSKSFKEQKVKIKPGNTDSVNVKLSFPANEKNIDIAIGYGYISEKDKTTAVSSLPKGRDYSNYSTIYDVIRANLPNVTVSNDCIMARGITSINGSSCALLIVDGITVTSIGNILPSEIKTISMLKDGAAAIYGSRGANGVVIIERKKGLQN